MKVLAINGSPRGEKGCTEKMLQPLLDGMRQAGAETETIYLANKKIHYCAGCLTCWTKTPGKCVFDDDMDFLMRKMVTADTIVFGTPLYYFTMSGLLKNFLDRTLPLALPFMEENENGVTANQGRYSEKPSKMILVSPCGFPEKKHFDALIATFKQIAQAGNSKYLGEILRPAAGMLAIDAMQPQLQSYYDLLKQAGQQLIINNVIDEKTHEALHQLFISPKDFLERTNKYFKSELDKIIL